MLVWRNLGDFQVRHDTPDPQTAGRPTAHDHNIANVGPHSGSVIGPFGGFKSPFGERASPLHLFRLRLRHLLDL
jgi:hypothetical protein